VQDVYWLGAAPAEEDCAQVGSSDYARRAIDECRRYIDAIRKVWGPEPEGARLTVKSQSHDFGTYYEVAVVFDGTIKAAAEYAVKCDRDAPKTWAEADSADKSKTRFQPGTIVTTVGAVHIASHEQIIKLLQRHLSGDWGDLDKHDAAANERALKWGERVLSSYTVGGEKIWIITEADRSSTTVLTPDEY
jgi:hypothetical protein